MTGDESKGFIKDFIEGLRKDLSHVDDFMQSVINGHLKVESHLDDVIDSLFFHASYIEQADLRFYQKVHIARASCKSGHAQLEWGLILALNSVRNKIAHRSVREDLAINLSNFRNLLREMSPSGYKVEDLNGHDLILYAVATCSGYLLVLRDELRELRGLEPLDD